MFIFRCDNSNIYFFIKKLWPLVKYVDLVVKKNAQNSDGMPVTLQGPVAVKVQVPNMQDKTEWKLNGQVLNFTVPLTDQVCKCSLIVSLSLVSVCHTH